MPEMSGYTGEDRLTAVRAYAAEAMGFPGEAITAVARFEDGNRHGVYRISYRSASQALLDVVVRVCCSGDAADLAQAEREAAVLRSVGGVAAPKLYDFRRTSDWFDTPAMCMQFLPGARQDVQAAGPTQIKQLAALVAWVHARPLDALGESMQAAATLASYADDRLQTILSTLAWARDPLPATLQDRLHRAADSLAESFEAARDTAAFAGGETLSLLHGDIAPGNVLWSPGPRLIDWEYTRLGDPADEIAYTLDQNALAPAQRRAFWDGYRHGTHDRSRLAHLIERASWWEPVTLLGSTLWWVERWVRRTRLDTEGGIDPAVPREPDYYLSRVTSRIDRLDTLASPQSSML